MPRVEIALGQLGKPLFQSLGPARHVFENASRVSPLHPLDLLQAERTLSVVDDDGAGKFSGGLHLLVYRFGMGRNCSLWPTTCRRGTIQRPRFLNTLHTSFAERESLAEHKAMCCSAGDSDAGPSCVGTRASSQKPGQGLRDPPLEADQPTASVVPACMAAKPAWHGVGSPAFGARER